MKKKTLILAIFIVLLILLPTIMAMPMPRRKPRFRPPLYIRKPIYRPDMDVKDDTKNFTINTTTPTGKILVIEPHPDDGILMMPGVIAMNQAYICCVGSMQNVPEQLRAKRTQAINWLKQQPYLVDYIFLENIFPMPPIKEKIKGQLVTLIEDLKPSALYTFTPYGWWGHPEHILTNEIVMEILPQLSYTPDVYWFVNTDQSIPFQDHHEDQKYPPNVVIDIDWDAKLEIWGAFAGSIGGGALQKLLDNTERMNNNDRKEYFVKV